MADWTELPKEIFEIVPELYAPAHTILKRNDLTPPQFLCLSILKRFGVELAPTDIAEAPEGQMRKAARLADASSILMELVDYSGKTGPAEVFRQLQDRKLILRSGCAADDYARLFSNDQYLGAIEAFLGQSPRVTNETPRPRHSSRVIILQTAGLDVLETVDDDVRRFVNAVMSPRLAAVLRTVYEFLPGSTAQLIKSIRMESMRLRASTAQKGN